MDANSGKALAESISARDWSAVAHALDTHGSAVLAGLLSSAECAALVEQYAREENFRKRVVMAQHGYGQGEYKYFAAPLPGPVASLRTALYPPLAQIANRWNEMLGEEIRFPESLDKFLARCHAAGQRKPTPLLLQYAEHDFNCLHQDVYGPHVFPLQAAVLLSRPNEDFLGGEFVLTEQRPRKQSRVEVVPLTQGDAVLFPVRQRPAQGIRKPLRVQVRHGVSRLRAVPTTGRCTRMTLGIIFHDAA